MIRMILLVTLLFPIGSCAIVVAQESIESEVAEIQRAAQAAMAKGDRKAVSQTASRLTDLVDLPSAELEPMRKSEMLLYAARLHFAVGDDRAFSLFRRVADLASQGSPSQVHASGFLLLRDIQTNEVQLSACVDLLADASELDRESLPVVHESQAVAYDALCMHLRSAASKERLVDEEASELADTFISAGVSPGVARISQLAAADVLIHSGDSRSLQTVLSISERLLAEFAGVLEGERISSHLRAIYWGLLSKLCLRQGHYIDAMDACRQYGMLVKSNPAKYATAYDLAAHIFMKLGDYEEAQNLLRATGAFHNNQLEQAKPGTLNPLRRRRIEWLVNYSKSLEGSNDFGLAAEQLAEAKRLLDNDSSPDPVLLALVENNRGLLQYLLGNSIQAEQLITRARSIFRDHSGEGVSFGIGEQVGESTVNAGWISIANSNFERAEKEFEEASTLFKRGLGKQHPRYPEALSYRARALTFLQRHEEAATLLKEAEQLVFERVCRELSNTASRRDRIAMIQEARVHPESIAWPGTIDTYLELAEQLTIDARDQYEVVLRWKGLLERFEFQRSKKEEDANEQNLMRELRNAYFKRVPFLERRQHSEKIAAYERQLRDLRRRKRGQLISSEKLRPSLDSVPSRLQPQDVLVDIYQIRTFVPPSPNAAVLGANRSYIAFVVESNGDVCRIHLGDADEIDSLATQFNDQILEAQYFARRGPASEPGQLRGRRILPVDKAKQIANVKSLDAVRLKLANSISLPLKPFLHEGACLHLCPDGRTHQIPWAALPGQQGKRYLASEMTMKMVQHAVPRRALVPSPPELPSGNDPALLVLGGVQFRDLPLLSGTTAERKSVVSLFRGHVPEGQIYEFGESAKPATEESLMQVIPNCKWVHLATHGFFHRKDESNVFGVSGDLAQLQIGLVLAPPADPDASFDEHLTASEIRSLHLRNTELVVLSACESGLGKSTAGQGVQGLFNSIHVAGAKTVLGAVWEVDDNATTRLNERFYYHLWKRGRPPHEALNAAQRDMIQTAEDDPQANLLRHPYAWAAFVCSEQ